MARKLPTQWLRAFQKPKADIEHPPAPIENYQHQPYSDHSPVLLEDDLDAEALPEPETEKSSRPVQHRVAKLGHRAASTASSATQVTARRLGKFAKAWRWQLIWLGIFGVFGGTGAIALHWLSSAPPAVDCQQVTAQSLEAEQLFCAQQAAQTGNADQILASINLVKGWTTEHPLYGQSRPLLQDWSNAVLILARDRVAQRDIKGAVNLASQIPQSSPVYKDAQAAIDRWQAEYRRGEAIYAKILEALKKRAWESASQQMAQLALVNDPGWQERLGEVRERSNQEKKAWKFLQDARNFAKANPPAQLGQAIAMTDGIDRNTFIWTLQANQEVLRWRNTIIGLAIAQFDQQNIPAAVALVNSIPTSVQLTTANQDLIRLVRAREIETVDNYRAPGLERIVPLIMATQMVKQIDAQSPFASRAKTLIPRLEQKVQDLTQLNLASSVANLQQIPMLHFAIAQASTISPKRPGRLHAQTLVAQWQKELESMQDRPLLDRAKQVAKSGNLGNLKSAVAMATLVKPKRSLRIEAQTDIANWSNQIQIIEDRPILNNARSIASAGQLGRAIEVAGSIRPGRALYAEAQGLIGEWVYQIQIAEDRSILAQASRLASQGYLTRAIDVASGIGSGRPLFGEARGAIAQWAAERAAIWRQREEESQSVPSDEDPEQSSGFESPIPDPTPPASEPTPP
ncbi:hypothetical protein [Leptolyngbya sp. GGD]|uniref:hypothetical protein n=1 Tax=Leptolyngbya sp. GGD TaxID=2997907 RepID=UPI00227D578D|nr:hypothetical protein [Leptolyngbya sp. GGD]MCY6491499.1 hypothetical protein [Leptolyngbya sp. GGD]